MLFRFDPLGGDIVISTSDCNWQMAVARIQYRGRWPKELNLNQGDLVQVLFKEDEAWWFGRLKNGDEGYFPTACVELLQVTALTWPTGLETPPQPV